MVNIPMKYHGLQVGKRASRPRLGVLVAAICLFAFTPLVVHADTVTVTLEIELFLEVEIVDLFGAPIATLPLLGNVAEGDPNGTVHVGAVNINLSANAPAKLSIPQTLELLLEGAGPSLPGEPDATTVAIDLIASTAIVTSESGNWVISYVPAPGTLEPGVGVSVTATKAFDIDDTAGVYEGDLVVTLEALP